VELIHGAAPAAAAVVVVVIVVVVGARGGGGPSTISPEDSVVVGEHESVQLVLELLCVLLLHVIPWLFLFVSFVAVWLFLRIIS
jgi:hypothetical protein